MERVQSELNANKQKKSRKSTSEQQLVRDPKRFITKNYPTTQA